MPPKSAHPSLAHLYGRPLGDEFLSECRIAGGYLRQVAAAAQADEFAVFGYGSLMWDPGFAPAFSHPALLRGYSRRPCIWSPVYRGTPQRPGLVFGLDAGGSCRGFAIGLPRAGREQIIRQLFVREMFQGVYRAALVRASAGSSSIPCLTFVADRSSPAYAGRLQPAAVRDVVAAAQGAKGSCLAYWRDTQSKLLEHGIDWHPGFDLADPSAG